MQLQSFSCSCKVFLAVAISLVNNCAQRGFYAKGVFGEHGFVKDFFCACNVLRAKGVLGRRIRAKGVSSDELLSVLDFWCSENAKGVFTTFLKPPLRKTPFARF